jgi:hypothetical protein
MNDSICFCAKHLLSSVDSLCLSILRGRLFAVRSRFMVACARQQGRKKGHARFIPLFRSPFERRRRTCSLLRYSAGSRVRQSDYLVRCISRRQFLSEYSVNCCGRDDHR